MTIGIYKIENLVNGKCYIGSSVNVGARWRNHKSRLRLNKHINTHLQNSYNKYGVDFFMYAVVEVVNSVGELEDREQYWLDKADAVNEGYNFRPIVESNLGFKHSNASKIKMSEAKLGEKHNMFGKHHSGETKKKISKSLSGENSPMFGKHHSEETKQKMSRAQSGEKHPMFGKTHSEESKNKMSCSRMGEKNHMYGKVGEGSPIYGEKNHMSKMIVFNGKTQNITSWAKETGINYSTLLSRLNKGWLLDRALQPKIKK